MEEFFGWLVQVFMEGVVEYFLPSVVFGVIGFSYLHLRYWSKVQVQQVLVREYDNSYSNAGRVVVLNTVAAIGILLVLGFMIGAPVLHWLG
ncbi:hypothetical protein [Hymenobacter cavernae]|nr:hypothetical protein [Hymenobacter cavernae]